MSHGSMFQLTAEATRGLTNQQAKTAQPAVQVLSRVEKLITDLIPLEIITLTNKQVLKKKIK